MVKTQLFTSLKFLLSQSTSSKVHCNRPLTQTEGEEMIWNESVSKECESSTITTYSFWTYLSLLNTTSTWWYIAAVYTETAGNLGRKYSVMVIWGPIVTQVFSKEH